MKKIHLDSGKLHKTARFRYGITGTLCLILAAVLLYVQWGGQLLEARAAGEITYSAKDGLWSEGLKKRDAVRRSYEGDHYRHGKADRRKCKGYRGNSVYKQRYKDL